MFEEEDCEISLVPSEGCLAKAQTLLAMVPTLLLGKLETGESVAAYDTQRVLLQFGYDRCAFQISGDTACSSALVIVNKSVGARRHQILVCM